MKKIPLTQGKNALIDDKDFEWLNQWKWCYARNHGKKDNGYALSSFKINGKYKSILMHRLLLNIGKNEFIDHKNHNTLDNRKKNLRIVNTFQNAWNRKKAIKSRWGIPTSKYKGVSWSKEYKKWAALIRVKYKLIKLGYFNSEKKAVIAYKKAAIKYYGSFAYN